MAGLQDMAPMRSGLSVIIAVDAPTRAAALAASHPAWPPPTTITSKLLRISHPFCPAGQMSTMIAEVKKSLHVSRETEEASVTCRSMSRYFPMQKVE
jgi:hypothetical protein